MISYLNEENLYSGTWIKVKLYINNSQKFINLLSIQKLFFSLHQDLTELNKLVR
jgi:hypothetical protein